MISPELSGFFLPVMPPRRRSSRMVFFLLLASTFALCVIYPMSAGCSPAQGSAEKPYGLIFGTVWGPDNRPIYGVKIKIRREEDKENKARWDQYSDHRGEFAQRVPAGKQDYVIWADLKDFKGTVKWQGGDPVKVHIENDERVDVGLHLK